VGEESYILENLDATSEFIDFFDSLIMHLEKNIQCPKALSPFFPEKVKRTSVWKKHLNFPPFSFITFEGQPNRNCEKKPVV
jgi:hypothetical protein